MNQPSDKEREQERKEKGTSAKDLELAQGEQDKVKGGQIEKQADTVEKNTVEKQ